MAVMAKPRTGAFVLNSEKSEKFFSQNKYTADKALARVIAHKAKAGIVETVKDERKL